MRREGGSKGSRSGPKGGDLPGQTSRPVRAVPAMAGEQRDGGHHVQAFRHTEQNEGSTGHRRAGGNRASLRDDRIFIRRARADVHLLRRGSSHAGGCAGRTGTRGESGSLRPRAGDRQARGGGRGSPEPDPFRGRSLHACDVGFGGRLGSRPRHQAVGSPPGWLPGPCRPKSAVAERPRGSSARPLLPQAAGPVRGAAAGQPDSGQPTPRPTPPSTPPARTHGAWQATVPRPSGTLPHPIPQRPDRAGPCLGYLVASICARTRRSWRPRLGGAVSPGR